jgi:hypothetical protein
MAASCCGGANGADGFVLPKWERAMVGSSLRLEDTLDLRDSNGNALLTDQWRSTETKLATGGAIRLARDFQASASIPLIWKRVAAGTALSNGVGVGDAALQARYEIIDEETCIVRPVSEISWFDLKPSIHWVSSLTLPTGRTTGESDDPLGADVTGRGLWIGDSGIDFTKIWGRFGNSLQGNFGYQSGYEARDAESPPALRWSAGAGLLYFIEFQHSLALTVNHRRELFREDESGAKPPTISTTSTTLTWNRIFAESRWWLRAAVGQSGYLQGRNTPMLYDASFQVSKLLDM